MENCNASWFQKCSEQKNNLPVSASFLFKSSMYVIKIKNLQDVLCLCVLGQKRKKQ